MRFITLIAVALLAVVAFAMPATAGQNDPLFINLTTDDPHRAMMGINFGSNQMKLGHPLTIFFNDRAVMVADKDNDARFGKHHEAIADVLANGGTVIVCPMCMKYYGTSKENLVEGALVGKPELTGGALFQDNTITLTW